MSSVKWIKLSTNMFDDEKIKLIESLPDADTLLVIWIKLLSQAGKTNANGYIYLSENISYTEEMLSTIFNRPLQTVRLALDTFKSFGMISEGENKSLLVENWDKHQNVEGLEKIREQNRLRKQKQRDKQRQIGVSEGVTGQVTQCHATEEELELDKEKKKSSQKQVFDETSDCFKLAKFMYSQILKNNPEHKKPNLQKWADEFRKILDLDKRDKMQVQKLVKWVQADDFEMSNVLSPTKLRKRYDQLIIKMNKQGGAMPGVRNIKYQDLGDREF